MFAEGRGGFSIYVYAGGLAPAICPILIFLISYDNFDMKQDINLVKVQVSEACPHTACSDPVVPAG